jgi:hypothetical protein
MEDSSANNADFQHDLDGKMGWLPVERPRVRAVDGSGELALPSYQLFLAIDLLCGLAMERTLA